MCYSSLQEKSEKTEKQAINVLGKSHPRLLPQGKSCREESRKLEGPGQSGRGRHSSPGPQPASPDGQEASQAC